ncbi:MAG: hypothetical protein ABIA91_03585 [Patescibacteria group bacterium]
MSSKSLKILNIIVLSVVIVATGIFVFNKFYPQTKKLTGYLPNNTVAYFEFEPNHKDLLEVYENNKRSQTRFGQLIKETNFWGEFNSELITPQIKKIGLVILKDEEELQKVWLLDVKDRSAVETLLPKDFFASNLEKDVMMVTKEREISRMFQKQDEVVNQTEDQKNIYSKFSKFKFFNSYISKQYIFNLKDKEEDFNIFFLNNFNLDPGSSAYFSLRADENKIVFDFQSQTKDSQENKKLSNQNYESIKSFPLNDLVFVFETSKLKNITNELEKNIFIDEDNRQNLARKYMFDWGDFDKLTDYPATIFFKHQDDRFYTKDLLNLEKLDWGILINVEKTKEKDEMYTKLRNFLSYYLAFEFPVWQREVLEDQSSVTQVIANPNTIKWEIQNKVEFFEKGKFKFALANEDKGIYFSTNKEILLEILNQSQESDIIKECPDFDAQEAIFLNSKKLIKGMFSYVDQTLVLINKQDKDLDVKGCLLW